MRDALDRRFPSTGVRVNCPAVKVPFGTVPSETTEIVPADYVAQTGNQYLVYDIPDCAGGWMRSSPDAHNDYVRSIDNRHTGKVKPLIRFIKAWKFFKQAPISSFYLELRVAKYADGEKDIIYAYDVRRVFDMLCQNNLADMRDPMGVSGYIHACRTGAMYERCPLEGLTASARADGSRGIQEK